LFPVQTHTLKVKIELPPIKLRNNLDLRPLEGVEMKGRKELWLGAGGGSHL
jgi:hypothetical protein